MKNDLVPHNQEGAIELLAQVPQEAVWLKNYVSKETKATYELAVRQFISFFGLRSAEDLKKIDQAHIIAYRDSLIDKGYTPKTIHTKLSTLSSLFDFLCEKQELQRNATTGVQRPQAGTKHVKAPVLTEKQVRKLLNTPNYLNSRYPCRDKAVLYIFFYTGCRISEISRLMTDDFYMDEGYWVLDFIRKGGKRGKVAIHQECQIAINNHLEESEHLKGWGGSSLKNRPLIGTERQRDVESITRQQIHYIFKKHAGLAGLPKNIRPHSARSTVITWALNNGASLETVQELAGHADISTTRMYDKRRFQHKDSASFSMRW